MAAFLVGAAQAADLSHPSPIPVPPSPIAMAAAFNWAGAYFGLHGGYAWGSSQSAYDDPLILGFNLIPIDPMNSNGWYGGAQAGVNHQLDNGLVFGIEADVSYGGISGTIHDQAAQVAGHGANHTVTARTDLAGSVRGRLGQAFDRTLVYGTGGLAWTHTTVSATDGNLSEGATLLGWTVGAGVEHSVTDNVSVKLEYLYSAFGNHTWFAGQAWQSTGSSSSNTVRAGFNVHF